MLWLGRQTNEHFYGERKKRNIFLSSEGQQGQSRIGRFSIIKLQNLQINEEEKFFDSSSSNLISMARNEVSRAEHELLTQDGSDGPE